MALRLLGEVSGLLLHSALVCDSHVDQYGEGGARQPAVP